MSGFTGFESVWASYLGNLRDTVRQHVIADQLDDHLAGVRSVLDVGCGQGTQALRLAAAGLDVTGVDPSDELLDRLRETAARQGIPVDAIQGEIASLATLLDDRAFDLVCAHGLLMYLDDPVAALSTLLSHLNPGGTLSFTVRNGDALAYRPGIRRDYTSALEAFDARHYRNTLGVDATAHRRSDVDAWCAELGLHLHAWYGVRVLTDGVAAGVQPAEVDLDACLAAEARAGRQDPYRRFGSMIHYIARAD